MSSPIKQTARWLRENAEDGMILCRCPAIIVESHLPLSRFTQAWGVNDEELHDFVASRNISYIVSDFGRFENACRGYTVVYVSRGFVIYKVTSRVPLNETSPPSGQLPLHDHPSIPQLADHLPALHDEDYPGLRILKMVYHVHGHVF